jgi:metal-responsive CopG/Arc/MetJ family transcriptional regulator
MASTRLSIRISKSLQKEIKKVVRATKKTESQVVRDAVEAYCHRHKRGLSCYDVAVDAGIIGIADNLPADLSTNPKYMEGFGRD